MKKNRGLRLLGFVLLLGACFLTAQAATFAVTTDSEVLARVDVDDNPAYLGLPVHAHLQDGNGQSYVLVITTRNSNSGTPITKATQYVYEFLQKLTNMTVSYHSWNTTTGKRNVVAEKKGDIFPNQIVLVVAHMDDMPAGGAAPGADDNAGGSAAVMALAEMINKVPHKRTVRFVLFTGEEQGLLGSAAYANLVANRKNVAVFNMDMISYEGDNDPVM